MEQQFFICQCTKNINSKQKTLKQKKKKKHLLCLENIFAYFSANIMKKKTKTKNKTRRVYDFHDDYRAFDISNISNIHKYLMEKHDIK